MPVGLIIAGFWLLVLDQVLNKEKVAGLMARLTFFIEHYEPGWRRGDLLAVIAALVAGAAAGDYWLTGRLEAVFYLKILLGLVLGAVMVVILAATGSYLFQRQASFTITLWNLEREFIQQFSLAVCHPLFGVAYLIRGFLWLGVYPPQGLGWCRSFWGLAGLLLVVLGIVLLM